MKGGNGFLATIRAVATTRNEGAIDPGAARSCWQPRYHNAVTRQAGGFATPTFVRVYG